MNLWTRSLENRQLPVLKMEDAASLLKLAFLFTGDERASEKAVLDAFDFELSASCLCNSHLDSLTTSVVGNALSSITLQLAASARRTELQVSSFDRRTMEMPERPWSVQDMKGEVLEEALLAIDLFPRCVLILTIFQKYTVEHVASLLTTTKRLTRAAQMIALTELTRNVARRQGWEPVETFVNVPQVAAFATAG